jgi:hypothetical protein
MNENLTMITREGICAGCSSFIKLFDRQGNHIANEWHDCEWVEIRTGGVMLSYDFTLPLYSKVVKCNRERLSRSN